MSFVSSPTAKRAVVPASEPAAGQQLGAVRIRAREADVGVLRAERRASLSVGVASTSPCAFRLAV